MTGDIANQMTGDNDPTHFLLSSKLFRPRMPSQTITRRKLLSKLDQGTDGRLVLVAAPAGYGKTTLVNSWLDTQTTPCAWLSIDDYDADLATFVAYLVSAVRTCYPAAAQDSWSMARSAQVPEPARLAAHFITDLLALRDRLILVIDDYDAVKQLDIHAFMTRLVSRLPRNVHLVIISRADPPLALSRLRAQDQLVEIRSVELAFTLADTAEYLDEYLETAVAQEVAAVLQERTEGWPAGLQLAAIALREGDDPADFARRFARSGHRLVSDYLLDEVVGGLSDEIYLELLRTALLDRFCAPLCDALAGPDVASGLGQRFVETLWLSNLFIVALDEDGTWYRYHHLFRELLRGRLGRRYGENAIRATHMRASAWFAARGLVGEAVQHAVQGNSSAGAIRLMEEHFNEALERDEWRRVERWISYLPQEARDWPTVQIMQGFVYHFRFQLDLILPLMDAAEAALLEGQGEYDERKRTIYLGLVNALRVIVYGVTQKDALALRYAEKALIQVPQEMGTPYGILEFHYHAALQRAGKQDVVLRAAQDALQQQPPDSTAARSMRLLLTIGSIHYDRADVQGTLSAGRQIYELAQRVKNPNSICWGTFGIAWAHYERDDLEAATRYMQKIHDLRYEVHARLPMEACSGQAVVYLAQGRLEEARAQLDILRDFLLDRGMPDQMLRADALELRINLAERSYIPPLQVLDRLVTQLKNRPPIDLWLVPQLTVVLGYLRLGGPANLEKAAAILAEYGRAVRSGHTERMLLTVGALETLVVAARGNDAAALEVLRGTVLLGATGGALRAITDAGPGLRPFLQRLLADDVAPAYVSDLLAVLTAQRPFPAAAPPATSTPERPILLLGSDIALKSALTNREIDVLLLLAQRLSNKEIGARLSLSPHTVKKHSLSLYKKLGATNRREAVARAQALGLLPS